MKYVVAFRVPENIVEKISSVYSEVVGRKIPASNMHISLTYPFTILDNYSQEWVMGKLRDTNLTSIKSKTDSVGVFEQKKNLLYVGVEPFEDYFSYHKSINKALEGGIKTDRESFAAGKLPSYKPHISIDYDFDGNLDSLELVERNMVEEWFESGQPLLFGFDENMFRQISV